MVKFEQHELKYGPHFNEDFAEEAVSRMQNEDGTTGPHWTIEQTNNVAKQYGINFNLDIFNEYDWFVAMNMIYSDYYKAIKNITGINSLQHFVELTKAWIMDKDVAEGKMWYYFKYVMCDKFRDSIEYVDEEEYEYHPRKYSKVKHKMEYYSYPDEEEEEYYSKRKPVVYRYVSKY